MQRVRSRDSLDHADHSSQRKVQVELPAVAVGCRWQRAGQLDRVCQVLHRFGRRRAPESALARLAPISNRLIENAALRGMMGKDFRLRLADLWKALLERFAAAEV